MTTARLLAVTSLGIVVGVQPLSAQSLSRYRAYALESTIASVVKVSGAREADLKTLHERPARIQEIEWRAPYLSGTIAADPVRNLRFSFYDNQLYRVGVTYERDRMEGLTEADVIDSISSAYGALPMQTRSDDGLPMELPTDTAVVARWDDGASLLVLLRGRYSNEFQLVLTSKQLGARAREAMKEAARLDVQEAPQREANLRTKEASDVRAGQEKARVVNKAAFKP